MRPLRMLSSSAFVRRSLTVLASASLPVVKLPPGLVNQTPLLQSLPLSAATGASVWLKMDALQPSGSFKDRGMAFMCATLQKRGVTDLISSSGGNAGLAASAAGRKLGMRVRVIVPETTKKIMLDKIKAEGAEVEVHGANWNAADERARQLVAESDHAAYVPPYEDPLLWEGHSSLVDELAMAGVKPDAIVLSVGGGGLLCGVIIGLQRHGWDDVTVLTAETEGAACFARAHRAGSAVRLDGITSVATSLGALQASDTAIRLAQEHPTWAYTVTDYEAVSACASLLDDHRVLVEPACGAALALLYSEKQRQAIAPFAGKTVVVIVCGGGGVNADILDQWKRDVLLKDDKS